MKKLLIILIIITFFPNYILTSKAINKSEARQIAINFFNGNIDYNSTMDINLSYSCNSVNTSSENKINDNRLTYYYVFNNEEKGFVIISGDDNASPILGYSNKNSFNPDNMPANLRKWLESYKEQIRYIIENNIGATENIKKQWQKIKSAKSKQNKVLGEVLPLIDTEWSQSPYYNDYCPYDSSEHERAVVGCVATAMAQIMKYWEYPETGSGFHSYQ
ncbi:MAG: Spi family protease inhibitor, partial [Chlorobi bacterium]|nr:Spi family protease inhibitor [Chlorobiota bacterium]